MITEEKMLWSLIKLSLVLFLKEMYGDHSGEFSSGYWDLRSQSTIFGTRKFARNNEIVEWESHSTFVSQKGSRCNYEVMVVSV